MVPEVGVEPTRF